MMCEFLYLAKKFLTYKKKITNDHIKLIQNARNASIPCLYENVEYFVIVNHSFTRYDLRTIEWWGHVIKIGKSFSHWRSRYFVNRSQWDTVNRWWSFVSFRKSPAHCLQWPPNKTTRSVQSSIIYLPSNYSTLLITKHFGRLEAQASMFIGYLVNLRRGDEPSLSEQECGNPVTFFTFLIISHVIKFI